MKRPWPDTPSTPTPRATPSCAQAIADKIFELHRVRYAPAEIMATVGATMAIYAAIRAFVGRGDNAIVISPAYAIFSNGVIMSGGEPRPVPLARRGTRVSSSISIGCAPPSMPNTRMLIVNSPSNPTGWMITEDEQRALVEIADRHDLVLLADEVYERLVYDREGVAPSFARVETNRDRLIVVNSFSKTYNMTGWRLGWAQTSARTIKTMYKAVEFMTSNPTAMVQQAGHRRAPGRRAIHRGAARALRATPRASDDRAAGDSRRDAAHTPGCVLCIPANRRRERFHRIYGCAGA